MVGGVDHPGVVEDWMFPIPSPRFFSSVLKDDIPVESIDSNRAHFVGHEDLNSGKNGGRAAENVGELSQTRRAGGLLERIAARAGFNAPRLNTESIRPSDLSISQDVRSPYLTIPPGLSPTTLLESPVFLSNSLVQPSPTTGKFLFASSGGSNNKNCSFAAMASDTNKDKFFEDFGSQPFSFKPVADSGSAIFYGDENRLEPLSYHHQHSFQSIENSLQPQNGASFHIPMDFGRPSSENDPVSNSVMPENNTGVAGQQQGEDVELRSGGVDEDGYNWRKYGHKQVKGSEYPRSYYKCTHPNCTVKKKVERSHEGAITEIIYKGSHNHPEPVVTVSNHRSASGLEDQNSILQSARDGDSPWSMVQNETLEDNWKTEENLEANCLQPQKGAHLDSSIVVDRSSTVSIDEEEDDQQEDSESKRRKVEAYTNEMTGPTRAIREPRVVVQTTSDVDILDDGYRWRKYGQKVVKGNPNPRSYYKCTSAGCTVRKHVERASHDLRSVITTYEGKHNHDVPAARNSSHLNSANSTAGGSLNHLHRTTDPSQVQNEMSRFNNRAAAAASLGSFGLDGRQMMGHHGFPYGSMNPMGMGSLGSGMGSQGKMMAALPMTYMGQQQSQMGLMMMPKAKGDPKLEPISDQSINIGNNGSSIYHEIMSRLPPLGGPQM